MKHTATAALMLGVGVAAVYAQQNPVQMTFSGDAGFSTIDLKRPGTLAAEENLAGHGSLGQFTFRFVKASESVPQPSNTCSGPTKLYFPDVAGGGLFRFQDGSLLKVALTGGGDCIDFAANEANCTITFQVTGGTGRFEHASGVLTLTETATPYLADAFNNPLLFAETGELTGAISRAAKSAP